MKKILLLSLLALGGCSHSIHMVNVNGFEHSLPIEKALYVEASAEQKVIFWFAHDTNYVDEAKNKLLAQCDGDIRAVSTQFSTSHGFMHWTNKILMKGVCVKR